MREYAVVMEDVTVEATAPSLVIINPATNYPIAIMRAWWSQRSTAVSAQQQVALKTKATAFGTWTGATPKKLNTSDPISQVVSGTTGAAGTSGTDCSAEGGGTESALYSDSVNNLNGFLWVASPLEVLRFNQAQALAFTLRLTSNPSNVGNHSAGAFFAELA